MSERFFADGKIDGTAEITGGEFNHLVNVMRRKPGDTITLFNGDGNNYCGRVAKIDKRSALVEVTDIVPNPIEPDLKITIFLAAVKPERFAGVISKSAELGVYEVVSVITAFSQSPAAAFGADKLRKTAITAAKQCGRSVLVRTPAPVIFADMLKTLPDFDFALMPCEKETERDIKGAIIAYKKETAKKVSLLRGGREAGGVEKIAIIIGPEGGFSTAEVQSAQTAGAVTVSLGKVIMRSETAAIYTAGVLTYELT